MLKNIFELLVKMIFSPAKAWNILSEKKESDDDSFFKIYLYPIIGIIALVSFVGVFFNRKEFDVQIALKTTIIVLVALFIGFHLASFLLSELMVRMFQSKNKQIRRCRQFTGYSSALIYVLYFLLALFPEFVFLRMTVLYSVYVIWEGASPYMGIIEDKKLKFTIFASIIVIVSPFLIEAILYMTMPGLRS